MNRQSLPYIHLCNLGLEPIPEENICTSFHDFLKVDFEGIDYILINIHLNWENHRLSNNYGFDIAQQIRMVKKSKLPIVFYSPIQKEYFEQKSKNNLKYKILFAPGTAFLELPFSEKVLNTLAEKLPVLSSATLQDISLMLCDTKGLVLDKLNHNLKFGADIGAVLSEAVPFLTQNQMLTLDWHNFATQITTPGLTKENFDKQKDAFLAKANQFLLESINHNDIEKTGFKVLLIDDVKEDLEMAKAALSPSFDVLAVQTAQKAIELLDNDRSGDIKVVVSDWRLYKDDSQTYWQSMQGYDILQYAGQNSNRQLVALTSQADFIVNHIRNIQDLKITLYKKQFLKDEIQWQIFSGIVYEKCIDAVSNEVSAITSKAWTNVVGETSYKQLYFTVKSSLNSYVFFKKVDEKVDECWNYIMSFAKTDFKNILNIKEHFSLEIPKKSLDLQTAMIHRRLWIGLWHYISNNETIKSHEAASDLITKVFKIICWGNYGTPTNNDIGAELNKFFLQKKDFAQQNYLPEEKNWLKEQGLLPEK
ncbi:MAG: hypothetical protein M9888_04855 [Chitinophagales bacterium]|nr:hypothetical protein [Chitinophagales bacterium]